jgi:hypothetical protein
VDRLRSIGNDANRPELTRRAPACTRSTSCLRWRDPSAARSPCRARSGAVWSHDHAVKRDGGASAQGTATLTAAAPAGRAVITLSSSNTAVATVPASVTVAAGSTSATFTVTTQAVAAFDSGDGFPAFTVVRLELRRSPSIPSRTTSGLKRTRASRRLTRCSATAPTGPPPASGWSNVQSGLEATSCVGAAAS